MREYRSCWQKKNAFHAINKSEIITSAIIIPNLMIIPFFSFSLVLLIHLYIAIIKPKSFLHSMICDRGGHWILPFIAYMALWWLELIYISKMIACLHIYICQSISVYAINCRGLCTWSSSSSSLHLYMIMDWHEYPFGRTVLYSFLFFRRQQLTDSWCSNSRLFVPIDHIWSYLFLYYYS